MRRLLELLARLRFVLTLGVLALALWLVWFGLHFGNVVAGVIGGALFFALWLYVGFTNGFDGGSVPQVHESNPASGQAIIPETRGLSSDGSYTSTRQ